jgi:acyl-[acyl-carrier-protein] desaturase
MIQVETAGETGPLTLVAGPWTRAARAAAVEQETLQAFVDFFGRALRTRRWSPWHDLPVEEMREHGPRLSADTVDLLEGFLGIEEFVGDFVREGLGGFRQCRTRRNLHLQWGAEEMRHGVALEQTLLHTGVRTQAELDAYHAQLAERQWSAQDHRGVDGPLGSAVYGMLQERATQVNYEQLRRRVRAEYGLPARSTPAEARRGRQIGVAEALRLIAQDEIAHHGLYLQMVRIHLRHFPEETLDKLQAVASSFHMPALRLIPNRRAFLGAVRRSRIFEAATYQEQVLAPVLRALKLEGAQPSPGAGSTP